MPLVSKLLSPDARLQKCLVSDAAHITLGEHGDHVTRIQSALLIVDNASVASSELVSQTYGQSTANAVLAFKSKRSIINRTYQITADNIVGKMTIEALDREVAGRERRGSAPVPSAIGSFT